VTRRHGREGGGGGGGVGDGDGLASEEDGYEAVGTGRASDASVFVFVFGKGFWPLKKSQRKTHQYSFFFFRGTGGVLSGLSTVG